MSGKRLRLSEEEVNLIYKSRAGDVDNLNYNLSHNSALDTHLQDRGIEKKDVVSVKHWQNFSGELRFSVVTKTNPVDEGEVFGNVLKLIEEHAPIYLRKNYKGGKHLLVINPADIHIGKYAHEDETGEAYNKDVAVKRVLEGVQGLIDKARGFEIERVLFCIGNDVLHIDSSLHGTTTSSGTHQDVDGRWWEHYETALGVYVACVEMLREVAPVDCIHSMSNHDYQSGFHLAHALKSWFRHDENVSVDAGVSNRKYYSYGKNLIGLEHGDGAKMDKLPLLMAQEKPQDWANATHRYWYLHHIHHKVKHKWLDAKDYIGVTVEYMRSPSGTDAWHSRKGFCGVQKAVEGFIHDFEGGQVARLVHYF
jgi:hypothetical protein|tara:strand:+ start:291 stop:1385 length:1095 start_codon:yes stop_codon:yes gene_type:complete